MQLSTVDNREQKNKKGLLLVFKIWNEFKLAAKNEERPYQTQD